MAEWSPEFVLNVLVLLATVAMGIGMWRGRRELSESTLRLDVSKLEKRVEDEVKRLDGRIEIEHESRRHAIERTNAQLGTVQLDSATQGAEITGLERRVSRIEDRLDG